MLKQRWQKGDVTLNGWLTIPDGFAAQIFATAGWDSLTIDMQHGMYDYASMAACLQAVQVRKIPTLVRVPSNEPGIIGKALDAGAAGIICPMVNSAEEAAKLVKACHFPPRGERSFGTIRNRLYAPDGGNLVEQAGQHVACLPMIETKEALDKLTEILDVEGVDGVYLGPNDLGLSLGLPPRVDRDEPEILKHYAKVTEAAAKRGRIAGIYCAAAAYAAKAINMGFRLVTVGNDSAWMLTGACAALETVRAAGQSASKRLAS